jgi:hypothetical protein
MAAFSASRSGAASLTLRITRPLSRARKRDGSSGLLEQALIRCPFLFPALAFEISTNTFIDGDEWNGCDFQKLRSGFSSTPGFVVT